MLAGMHTTGGNMWIEYPPAAMATMDGIKDKSKAIGTEMMWINVVFFFKVCSP